MFLSSINDLWQQIYDDVTLYGERNMQEKETECRKSVIVKAPGE